MKRFHSNSFLSSILYSAVTNREANEALFCNVSLSENVVPPQTWKCTSKPPLDHFPCLHACICFFSLQRVQLDTNPDNLFLSHDGRYLWVACNSVFWKMWRQLQDSAQAAPSQVGIERPRGESVRPLCFTTDWYCSRERLDLRQIGL